MAISPGGRPADATPLGKDPAGPRRLTDYVREVAHALMRDGHPESEAIAIARSQIAKWAAGAHHVHPAVQAGATASVAQQMILDHARRGRNG